jgi:cell shape-determining protein MreC
MDTTNYNLYLNRYKEMLKTAHHLSQLLKKTREENAMLRAELDKKTGLEGNH